MDDVILIDILDDELIIKDVLCDVDNEIIQLEIHDQTTDESLHFVLNIKNAQKLVDTLQDLIQNAEHMND